MGWLYNKMLTISTICKNLYRLFFHNSDIEDEIIHHQFCPTSKTSWCLWQSDKLPNLFKYQKKLNLPLAIHKVLILIFKDLSNQDLLKKCLHSQTQKSNESLNGIWKRFPKDIYVGKRFLKLSLNSAIISFNDGFQGVIKVLKSFGINTGWFMNNATMLHNALCISKGNHKSINKYKGGRS